MKRIIRIAMPFALALAASVSGPSALAQGMSGNMGAGRAIWPVRVTAAYAGVLRSGRFAAVQTKVP